MKCKHDWVRSGYGNDLICKICGYAAAQATLTMPIIEPMIQPNLREEVKVPILNGDKIEISFAYKDEIEKELSRAFNINLMAGGRR